jgi:hypothetical protein
VNEVLSKISQSSTEQGALIRDFSGEGKIIPTSIKIAVLRELIYTSECNKFALCDGFPENLKEVELFEKTCASFHAFYISTTHREPNAVENLQTYEIETQFFSKNKLHRFCIDPSIDAAEQLDCEFDDVVNRTRGRYVLVYGPNMSGRTVAATYLHK